MKATIALTTPQQTNQVRRSLITLIQGNSPLQQHITNHGIWFENLATETVAAFKQLLHELDYSAYDSTDTSVHLRVANNDVEGLLKILLRALQSRSAISKPLLASGVSLHNLSPDQANDLKKLLEADSAVVTITDTAATQYQVSGQIRWSDNRPWQESGHLLQADDVVSATVILPLVGPTALSPNGRYNLRYNWTSTEGRNGPNLRARLLNPEGTVVAEAMKPFADRQEVLDLQVSIPAPPPNYTLTGTVLDAARGNPLFDAQVVVQFHSGGQTLGSETVTTLSNGEFVLPLEAKLWADRASGQPVAVSFQVSQNSQPLATETRIPDLQPEDQTINVRVTVPRAEPEDPFIVQGTVSLADGSALADVLVRAFDRDMRSEELLGEQTTNAPGFYRISYSTEQFRRAEKGSADLVVRVYDQTDAIAGINLVELAATDIFFNAPPVATLDVTVPAAAYRGPSEWERHQATIMPLREGIEVAALTDEDLDFLAREAEIATEHLRHLRQDAQWAEAHDLAEAVFYGLLRQGLPTELRSLLAEPPSLLREALKAALAENQIPQALGDDLDGILERLLDVAVQLAFVRDPDDTTPALGDMLATAPVDTATQQAFVRFLVNYEGDRLWPEVQEALGEEPTRQLQFTLQSSQLTGGSLPLIRQIRQTVPVPKIQQVAGWSLTDWQTLIEQANDNGDAVPEGFEDASVYAQAIVQNIETWMPSDRLFAMARRTAQDLSPETTGAVVNLYKGLGLRDIQQDAALDDQTKLAQMQERIGLFERFHRNNATLDLRYADLIEQRIFVNGSPQPLNWEGIPETERQPIVEQARAFQRLMFIENTEIRLQLLSADYDSADRIANATPTRLTTVANLPPGVAQQIIEQALDQRLLAETIRWGLDSVWRGTITGVDNPDPAVTSTLAGLPDLRRLLGGQGFCDCLHCNSVLSQSAYFVDLMGFIKRHVSDEPKIFGDDGDARRNSPLYLPNRRPDLWELELSCSSIYDEVPYLEVVNHVFEQHLIAHLDLRGRRALGDLYGRLADPEGRSSFSQPFLLARDELRLYLSHFSLTPAAIAKALALPQRTYGRCYLDIADSEASIISEADGDDLRVRRLYGLNPTDNVNRIPMAQFLAATGLTRSQVGDVFLFGSSPRSLPGLVLLIERREEPESLGLQSEEFITSNNRARQALADLDRLHRWIRLWRKTGWSLVDFDYLMANLLDTGLITGLDETAIDQMAALKILQDHWQLTAEELVSLFHLLPNPSRSSLVFRERGNFYERVFGAEDFAEPIIFEQLTATLPTITLPYPATYRLLSGLSLSEGALMDLLVGLRPALVPDVVGESEPLLLNHESLSTLYRYSLLARKLQRSPRELLQIMALVLGPMVTQRPSLADLQTLAEQAQSIGALPLSQAQLAWLILDEPFEARRSPITTEQLIEFRAALQALPAASAETVTEIQETVQAEVATLFRWNEPTAERLLALVGVTPEALRSAAATSLPGEGAWEMALRQRLTSLEKWHLLRETFKFEPAHLAFIQTHPTIFPDPASPRLSLIRHLAQYQGWVAQEEPDLERMHRAIADINEASHEDIAWLLDLEVHIIASLRQGSVMALPPHPLAALAQLQQAGVISAEMGVGGQALADLASLDYAAMAGGRDAILAAFQSKYPDPDKRAELLAPYQERLLSLRRHGLVDYLLSAAYANASTRSRQMRFADTFDLYSYFLMDPEMEGCARTSWVLAGISSLQLYIHRCLMNLEQESLSAGSNADAVPVQVPPSAIPVQEWEWRKNYRVWEANRRVFLYPSNYLLPDLRDDKTPIFEELEDELLQQEISADTAEAAYRNYLSKFLRVANLKIAGAYRDHLNQTLYIFGHTPDDPPEYHYRTHKWSGSDPTKGVWSPWYAVDLPINAEVVSPVVHKGQLYLFWVEITLRAVREFEDGNAKMRGVRHSISLSYSKKNANRKWESPTKISFLDVWDRILFPVREQDILLNQEGLTIYILEQSNGERLSDQTIDTFYTLKGHRWNQIYPRSTDAGIRFYYRESTDIQGQAVPRTWFHRIDQLRKLVRQMDERFTSNPIAEIALKLAAANHYLKSSALEDSGGSSPFRNNRQITNLRRVSIEAESPSIAINSSYLDFIRNTEEGGFLCNIQGNTTVMRRIGTSVAERIAEMLYDSGLNAMLDTKTQISHRESTPSWIWPNLTLRQDSNHIDFSAGSGSYFKELYFHIPFLIAHHLNANQQFAEAQKWYHYIFDPTAPEESGLRQPLDRVWRYVRFRDKRLPSLQAMLTDEAALAQYRSNPFNPWAIARLRDEGEFQKAIVMNYIDNLLDWGDHLFTQDTYESINEATLLYLMALDILGERPVQQGPCPVPESITYENIEDASPGDFLVEHLAENLLPRLRPEIAASISEEVANIGIVPAARGLRNNFLGRGARTQNFANLLSTSSGAGGSSAPVNDLAAVMAVNRNFDIAISPQTRLFRGGAFKKGGPSTARFISDISRTRSAFCVPINENLLGYWDRVEDRLFKIRNCMNIRGLRRSLALYEPRIDPMLLVRAKAAGLTLDNVRTGMGQRPHHRFPVVLEKARSAAATVQSFGAALLSALEKKDGEELNLMRATHERNILMLTRQVRQKQIQEAQRQRRSLEESLANNQQRSEHYSQLIEIGLTEWETAQQASRYISTVSRGLSGLFFGSSSILALVPNLGSPFATTYGGKQLSGGSANWGQFLETMAKISDDISALAGLEASFQRRREDWEFQRATALQEERQISQQIEAAKLREEIAQRELEIFEKTVEQSNDQYDFIKDKFTRLGLYTWMSQHLTRLHREAYRLAYETALQAERAYQFERADSSTPFIDIEGTNWEQDRAGLLAGEHLQLQLQQLDQAHQRSDDRLLEITKHISLASLDPVQLITLRRTGSCEFSLPEILFDLDFPGHYLRRIKSVSLSIPCVTGPYTSVNGKLALLRDKTRVDPRVDPSEARYEEAPVGPDDRFRYGFVENQAIATSSAQNDSGLFELNFRDERYLPFEGAGAISDWKLDLSGKWRLNADELVEFPQFDFDTIADVILHLRYTTRDARDGGELKRAAIGHMQTQLASEVREQGLFRLFSLRHEFPTEWHRFLESGDSTFTVTLTQQHFPVMFQSSRAAIAIREASLHIAGREQPSTLDSPQMVPPVDPSQPLNRSWSVEISRSGLSLGDDAFLVCRYTVALTPAPTPPAT
jgi:hypothetical protein